MASFDKGFIVGLGLVIVTTGARTINCWSRTSHCDDGRTHDKFEFWGKKTRESVVCYQYYSFLYKFNFQRFRFDLKFVEKQFNDWVIRNLLACEITILLKLLLYTIIYHRWLESTEDYSINIVDPNLSYRLFHLVINYALRSSLLIVKYKTVSWTLKVIYLIEDLQFNHFWL